MTQPIYRVPDGPAEVVVAMLANIEAEGAVPLATVAARQQLWRRGGPSARLVCRLNDIANRHLAEAISL